jgi:hypothetical protein
MASFSGSAILGRSSNPLGRNTRSALSAISVISSVSGMEIPTENMRMPFWWVILASDSVLCGWMLEKPSVMTMPMLGIPDDDFVG